MYNFETIECDRCGEITKFQDGEICISEIEGVKLFICNECLEKNAKLEDYYESIINKRINKNKII
mgnify:CR=1 FL=1